MFKMFHWSWRSPYKSYKKKTATHTLWSCKWHDINNMRRFVQKQLKNFISGILLQMLHQTYFEIKLKIAPVTTIEESTNSKLNGM